MNLALSVQGPRSLRSNEEADSISCSSNVNIYPENFPFPNHRARCNREFVIAREGENKFSCRREGYKNTIGMFRVKFNWRSKYNNMEVAFRKYHEDVKRDAGTRDPTAYQISTSSLLILDQNVGEVPSDILDVS